MEQYTKQLQQLGQDRFMKAALKGAHAGALRAVSTLQRATSQAPAANPGRNNSTGAVNTGFYKRAWKSERLVDGARVFNQAVYAAVIESGRRAGATMPPTKDLTNWAQRKLGLSREDATRASYAIAKAIKRRGLAPRRVMTNQLPKIEADFADEVAKAVAKELANP